MRAAAGITRLRAGPLPGIVITVSGVPERWSKASVYFEDGLQKLLQVGDIPTTIVFDKQGRLVSRMNGFLPDSFVPQLTERIQSALTEAP